METAKGIEAYMAQANQLILEGKEFEMIRIQLTASGADESTTELVINQIKSISFLKRRKRGVLLGSIGSVLLITGFILTVVLYHAGIPFHYVMYGMTSIGVLLLMAGLIEVIGW